MFGADRFFIRILFKGRILADHPKQPFQSQDLNPQTNRKRPWRLERVLQETNPVLDHLASRLPLIETTSLKGKLTIFV